MRAPPHNVQHVLLMVAEEQGEYYRRMNSQLIVDKQSKQQHNLSDTHESVVFFILRLIFKWEVLL